MESWMHHTVQTLTVFQSGFCEKAEDFDNIKLCFIPKALHEADFIITISYAWKPLHLKSYRKQLNLATFPISLGGDFH